MKYTKYDDDKKVYIISKNVTCGSESDAEWKEDVGIPTSELDIDSILNTIKETGKGTGILRQNSFVVLYNGKRYIVQFYFTSDCEIVILIDDVIISSCFYSTRRNLRESQYLISEKDIEAWEQSKIQIAKNFGVSIYSKISITIY